MKKLTLAFVFLASILLVSCSSSEFDAPNSLKVSSVFQEGEKIPEMYTCDGKNINPSLNIENVPENSESLVIILEDPDAPGGTFTHWVAFNIKETQIHQDFSSEVGMNDFGSVGYGGPCPPEGTHRYVFKVYSLDKTLSFQNPPDKQDVLNKMEGHVLATGELMGRYR